MPFEYNRSELQECFCVFEKISLSQPAMEQSFMNIYSELGHVWFSHNFQFTWLLFVISLFLFLTY